MSDPSVYGTPYPSFGEAAGAAIAHNARQAARIAAERAAEDTARQPASCVHPASYEGECPCPTGCRCCRVTPALGERHTADSITDDALDALYDRAEQAEAALDRVRQALAGLRADANRYRASDNPALLTAAAGYAGAAARLQGALDEPAPADSGEAQ